MQRDAFSAHAHAPVKVDAPVFEYSELTAVHRRQCCAVEYKLHPDGWYWYWYQVLGLPSFTSLISNLSNTRVLQPASALVLALG